MTNTFKLTLLYPEHFPSPFPTPSFFPAALPAYKYLQHIITEDDCWIMLEHFFRKRSPHLGGKAECMQKHIYGLLIKSSEYLASFINRSAILHKNITLSMQDVSLNILFGKALTQLMASQGFPPFLVTKYSAFLHFQRQS